MSLREELKVDDNLALMKELEDRLKSQIDKLEHLRLSASEVKDNITSALSPSSESGFDFIQQNNADLKLSIADHLDWLARLNERMETLQMNTAVFIQMNTKPRSWNTKQASKRYNRWPKPLLGDDVQSELGWSPVHTRRNSDAASEMSCAW